LAVQEADRLGIAVYDHVPALREAVEEMARDLQQQIEEEVNMETGKQGNR
jgi:hypothetical protein